MSGFLLPDDDKLQIVLLLPRLIEHFAHDNISFDRLFPLCREASLQVLRVRGPVLHADLIRELFHAARVISRGRYKSRLSYGEPDRT